MMRGSSVDLTKINIRHSDACENVTSVKKLFLTIRLDGGEQKSVDFLPRHSSMFLSWNSRDIMM